MALARSERDLPVVQACQKRDPARDTVGNRADVGLGERASGRNAIT